MTFHYTVKVSVYVDIYMYTMMPSIGKTVVQNVSCMDPESFVRGGPTTLTFLFFISC